jgi:hypothetical protein
MSEEQRTLLCGLFRAVITETVQADDKALRAIAEHGANLILVLVDTQLCLSMNVRKVMEEHIRHLYSQVKGTVIHV